MILRFRQRMFSWFDSYDIWDAAGNRTYTVKGKLSWGHCLKILDPAGQEVGMVKEKVVTLLPRFDLYLAGARVGSIAKKLTLFRPEYDIDCRGWRVTGSITEWEYRIQNRAGETVAVISKELFHLTDTYVIEVRDPEDAIYALMMVLAIDADMCSRSR